MENFRFKLETRVRFRDVDSMGHANNAIYFTYFEEARFAYCRHLNCLIPNESTISFIILDNYCLYKDTLKDNERLEVYIRISEISRKSFKFFYQIVSLVSGKVAATGHSTAVAYDYSRNKTVLMPEEVKEKILQFEELKTL